MHKESKTAGRTTIKFALNLSLIFTPSALVAASVVSDMNERLSPKNAPPTTIPTMYGRLSPVSWAMPHAIGTTAAIVPMLVPTENEIRQAVMNSPAYIILAGMMPRVAATVASTAPMFLAIPAKAPARMKIRIIWRTPLSSAPFKKSLIIFLASIFRFVSYAKLVKDWAGEKM